MALIIGEDSYVTVNEATTYISSFYLSTDPLRIAWSASSEADKEVFLKRACIYIESLPLRGRKASESQKLAFPRSDNSLAKVKLAQSLQAAAFTDTAIQDELSARQQLQASGVKSYQIGNLSETFQKNTMNVDPKVLTILHCYLVGGFRICI